MIDKGAKHICCYCGVKFYDLNLEPITCPKCSARWWTQSAINSELEYKDLVRGAKIKDYRNSKLGHHSVYVALLRSVPGVDGDAYYVGLTGNSPEQRFLEHKRGFRAGKGFVRKYGVALIPEFYEKFNPKPYEVASALEPALFNILKEQGLAVFGGH